MSKKNGAAAPDPSPAEVILSHCLLGFEPVGSYQQGVEIFTTSDIIANLADMMDLEPNDVANFMVRAGYIPGHNGSGSFGWMLRRVK